METSDIIQLVIVIILLSASAFFSSAETALMTSNKLKMRNLAENGDKRAAKVLKVTENTDKMLSAILIGNNIVNLTASSISTALTLKIFGSKLVGIATGILTFLILVFGEIKECGEYGACLYRGNFIFGYFIDSGNLYCKYCCKVCYLHI